MFKVLTLEEYINNETHYATIEDAIAGVASELSAGTPKEDVQLWQLVPLKITFKVEVSV